MSNVQSLPGAFPLHENKDFLSEREWVCLRLICHSQETIADADPKELSAATAGQISPDRATQIVNIARIARDYNLGTWFSRLAAEADFDAESLRSTPAEVIMQAINNRAGYIICNQATVHALAAMQAKWQNDHFTTGTGA